MNLKHFAVVAALCTMAVSAQNYRGTFTLPVDAQWGLVHLQAGEYTVTTNIVGSAPVVYLTGNGVSASILPGPASRLEPSDKGGHLELTEVNGSYAVTKLFAGAMGREFSFPIPKGMKQGSSVVALKKAVIPMQQ